MAKSDIEMMNYPDNLLDPAKLIESRVMELGGLYTILREGVDTKYQINGGYIFSLGETKTEHSINADTLISEDIVIVDISETNLSEAEVDKVGLGKIKLNDSGFFHSDVHAINGISAEQLLVFRSGDIRAKTLAANRILFEKPLGEHSLDILRVINADEINGPKKLIEDLIERQSILLEEIKTDSEEGKGILLQSKKSGSETILRAFQ